MTSETATNARSYDLPEGRIRRANTEQEGVRFNGESVMDLARRILKYEIPELHSMDAFYRKLAERLNRSTRANLPTPTDTAEHDLYAFDVLPDLDALAEAQGVFPTTDASALATDDWPEDESVEDFIAAAMEGRHEEDESDS